MANMPGGINEISGAENDAKIEELARFSLEEANKQRNSEFKFEGVVSARQQVVAGLLVHIVLDASSGSEIRRFEAKVWEKPWENFRSLESFTELEKPQLTSSDLGSAVEKGSNTGDNNILDLPVDDPAVEEAAGKVVSALQNASNSLYPYELDSINSATLEREEGRNGGSTFHLVLKLKRESVTETFRTEVYCSPVGQWSLRKTTPI